MRHRLSPLSLAVAGNFNPDSVAPFGDETVDEGAGDEHCKTGREQCQARPAAPDAPRATLAPDRHAGPIAGQVVKHGLELCLGRLCEKRPKGTPNSPVSLRQQVEPLLKLFVPCKPARHPSRLERPQFAVQKSDKIGVGRPAVRCLDHPRLLSGAGALSGSAFSLLRWWRAAANRLMTVPIGTSSISAVSR